MMVVIVVLQYGAQKGNNNSICRLMVFGESLIELADMS